MESRVCTHPGCGPRIGGQQHTPEAGNEMLTGRGLQSAMGARATRARADDECDDGGRGAESRPSGMIC